MAGIHNEVLYGANMDFTGATPVTGQITLDGQIFIGAAVAPFLRANRITSTNNSLNLTFGAGTINIESLTGAIGTIFQGQGAGIAPAFSTATYPSVATTAGTILRADGTNWSATTATYPNTSTANQLLYSSATNTIGGLTSANNGTFVTSNTGVPSILAGPGTTGNIFQSNAAAAPSFSTATYPSVATGTGTILRADGTNWSATTATYPNVTTINQVLYSSAANVISGLATANNAVLATDGTGVPSITATPTVTSIRFGSGTALSIYEEGTFTPTMRGETTAGTTTYTAQNGYYTRIGNMVFVSVTVFGPNATGTGNILFSLPFTVKNQTGANGISAVLTASAATFPTSTTNLALFCVPNTTTARIYGSGTGVAGGFLQLANVAYNWQFTAVYQI